MERVADICIVGAGIFGITAALELRKRGYTVVLIDAGTIPNPLAASTDISKIIRMEYGSDETYMEMAEISIQKWRQWNTRWSNPLFHETGVCMMTKSKMSPGEFEYESYNLLLKRKHKPLRLDASTINNIFPAWKNAGFVDGYYHAKGGYAESGKVIEELKKTAIGKGINIHENSQVKSIIIENGKCKGVQLVDSVQLYSGAVLICGGSWSQLVIPELVHVMKASGHPVFHLQVDELDSYTGDKFPVFTADISNTGWYGFPAHPIKKAIKIANHGIGIDIHPVDDERKVLAEQEQSLWNFVNTHLPQLNKARIIYRRLCLYSDTKDEHFWIDKHPTISDLFVASGGSGHGFKFAPIYGSMISDLIEDRKNKWLQKFKWRTFDSMTKGEEAARHHG